MPPPPRERRGRAVQAALTSMVHPSLLDDPEERRKAEMLSAILVIGVFVGVSMVLVRSMTTGPTAVVMISLASTGVVAALAGVLRRTGARREVADAFIALGLVALTAAGWLDGGLGSPALYYLLVMPMLAQFVGGRLDALSTTAGCWVSLVLLFAAGLGGLLPAEAPDGLPLEAQRLASMALAMAYVGGGSWAYEQTRRLAIQEREALMRVQRDWVSVVSHELRTPLTSIRGAVGLLASGAAGALPERAQRLAGLADASCARLGRLVDDVLDLERVTRGELVLREVAVDLAQLVQEVLERASLVAEARGVSLRLEQPDPLGPVRLDPDRVVQVVDNLLSNALKFSPPDSEVVVALADTPSGVRLTVLDEGPGVPAAFRERLFERFAQADSGAARAHGGTGLGLAICKALVEAHGGQIAHRDRPGGGAAFSVLFPLERSA